MTEDNKIDLDVERKDSEEVIAKMRQLDRESYFEQDIIERIDQVRIIMELENIDPLIWRDEGVGITLSDVLYDAKFEIRRLRPDIDTAGDIGEQGHWIAAPMNKITNQDTEEQRFIIFHEIVDRAEKVITLLKAREQALRTNLDIASEYIKDLEAVKADD